MLQALDLDMGGRVLRGKLLNQLVPGQLGF